MKRALFLAVALMFSAATAMAAAPGHALGTSPCVWAAPLTAPGGAIDAAATIRTLHANGFSCYVWVLEGTNWTALPAALDAARAGGIAVWVVLIPPSEGQSPPFGLDFARWMRELGRLSRTHPALRGVNIDDLDQGANPKLFTRYYVCELQRAKRAVAPDLLFTPTVYDLDTSVANRLAGCVDGVWLWWTNLEKNTGWPSALDNVRLAVRGRFPIYAGVYASATSWHREGRPLPRILREGLSIACRHGDGALVYTLPLLPKDNPWLATARSFEGRCGESWSAGVEATR
ncbi:MAG TPA: hypothetical protein VE996_00870 [Terriglobales bacterium]|nr:hypothetical protein [Terriglobales bacterium]